MLVPIDPCWVLQDPSLLGAFQISSLLSVESFPPPPPAWLLEPAPSSPQQVPGARYTGPLCPPLSHRPVAYQGDEVGEGEFQADIDHIRIVLSGSQVGIVVVHQVCEQPLLLVPGLSSCNSQQ